MVAIYWIFAVANVANGLWMLVSPESWYFGIPAAVPDTGPLNLHFVRDVGVTFTVCGIGLGWCAGNLDRALPVHVGVTLFYVGHAAMHGLDIVCGRLPPSHWLIDALPVFAPTLVLLAMARSLPRSVVARAQGLVGGTVGTS